MHGLGSGRLGDGVEGVLVGGVRFRLGGDVRNGLRHRVRAGLGPGHRPGVPARKGLGGYHSPKRQLAALLQTASRV